MRNTARTGLLLLMCAIAPTLAGCRVPQPPQVETAGLRVDVQRVKQKRGIIDCRLRLWNDYDVKLSFPSGAVRLMFGDDREVSIRPDRRGQPVEVIARNNDELRWIFEVGEDLPKGTYDVEIRDFLLDGVPSGRTAVFAINL